MEQPKVRFGLAPDQWPRSPTMRCANRHSWIKRDFFSDILEEVVGVGPAWPNPLTLLLKTNPLAILKTNARTPNPPHRRAP
jgi:hypothetical protein